MALSFARLEQEVAEQSTVIEGAVALLKSIAEDIRQNSNNQIKINELADKLDAQTAQLATALVTNTPSEPTEPVATVGDVIANTDPVTTQE